MFVMIKEKYNGPLMGECESKNIPTEYLEEMVWNDIFSFINNPGEVSSKIDHEILKH